MEGQVANKLNKEKNQLSKPSSYPDAGLFRVWLRIVDVKELYRYKYGDDTVCRCCGLGEETVNHVWRECGGLESEACQVNDEYSEELEVLEKVLRWVTEFLNRVDVEEEDEVEE